MNDVGLELPPRKVAFLGAFLPRRCRVSPITTRLYQVFAAEFGGCECVALAMSDGQQRYRYPSQVRFEIAQADQNAYQAAADFLNLNDVDLVCIQHDFQLFDGDAGGYILAFARALKMPLVSVLHMVPPAPGAAQRQVIAELAGLSSRVIVIQRGTGSTLQAEYGVPRERVLELSLPDGEGEQQMPGGSAKDSPAWQAAARRLMECFQEGRQAAARRMAQNIVEGGLIPATGSGEEEPPALKLDHFLRMTDETGLLKASVLSLPDYRQGYTTADNARALMFSLLLEQVGEGPFIPIEMQASRHMAFLWNAFNPDRERFRDAMSYRREWSNEEGTEDTHGLAVWALGMALGRTRHQGMLGVARRLFEAALPSAKQFTSLRGWAFSLLGIQEYLERFTGDRAVAHTGRLLLDRLVNLYQEASRPDWPWFEEALAGGSASVSQALIASGRWAGEPRAAEIGLQTLDWLASLQFSPDGMYAPLGDIGYHRRGGKPARFAQRPMEARAMIAACLEAYRYSQNERWIKYARGAFQWFLGRNELGQPLYDAETGGCCDGLLPGKVDPNFSAEALLAFLMAQLEMRLFDQLYCQRTSTSLQLPILHIGSPNPIIHIEE